MYHIFTEPLFVNSPWCKGIFDGLVAELAKRRSDFSYFPSGYMNLEKNSFAFLIGNNECWLESTIRVCEEHCIHPIILSCQSDNKFIGRCSCVSSNVMHSMSVVINYLKENGRTSTALFGVNKVSLTNMTQLECYKKILGDTYDESCVYFNTGSVDECSDRFINELDKYDSIIGVNDFATVQLIKKLSVLGKEIPVISYGSSELAKKFFPDLLSVSMGYEDYGAAALSICDALKGCSGIDYIRMVVKCKFDDILNGALNTRYEQAPRLDFFDADKDIDFYNDDDLLEMLNIENMLLACDETDNEIIKLLLADMSYEQIAEKLYCAPNTVKYRVKKMKENCVSKTKNEMVSILRNYCEI